MPRKSNGGSSNAANFRTRKRALEPDWGGFIDVRISDQDKADFDVWATDNSGTMWGDFQDLLAVGFKFSLSYDPDGDFYLATFTAAGQDIIGIDLRCCLTARAPEWEVALHLLLFKHYVMAKGNWGSYHVKSGTFKNFG